MEPPIKPDESDCCNSGCNRCILDVYEEQLRKFQKASKGPPSQTSNCLSITSFVVFRLVKIEKHTRDCNLYMFEYVRPQKTLNTLNGCDKVSVVYKPGQHLFLKGNFHYETFQKAYTPLFMEDLPKNQFTVLVKLYDNGRMSSFFRRLSIGCETLWRGPYGDFKVSYEEENILFIAQGTGIAPLYNVICDILNNEECYTFMTLFFCCDIENLLLRDELYKLMQYWNFKYELFLSESDQDKLEEKYNEVIHFYRLSQEHMERFLKGAKGKAKILICGAESFCENIKNMLVQCEVAVDDITVF